MDFQDVVRRRRMVRAYQPGRAVPAELRERILANARRGPSAGFTQGFELLVLESGSERAAFWAATAPAGELDGWLSRMREAPLLIVCLAHEAAYADRYAAPDKADVTARDRRPSAPFWVVDTGMAALLMLQTAVDCGLGACFFGVPAARVASLRQAFAIPRGRSPIGVVAVGYADPERDHRSPSLRRGRRPEAEVVHRGRWGGA